jgi:SAM-dependent methyltransferase
MQEDHTLAFDAFASIYDAADMDRSVEIGYYRSLLPDAPVSLLELGCGTGTMLVGIADAPGRPSLDVSRWVGLDTSPRMLEVARRRLPQVDWREGDMRRIPADRRHDWVLCCFHTLQLVLTVADLTAVFRSVRDVLVPGGHFAFDVYQPNLRYLTGPMPDKVVRRFVDAKGDALEVREHSEYDPAPRILTTQWCLHAPDDGPAAPPRARMVVPMRQYFQTDLEGLLAASGLKVVERYGHYDRRPVSVTAPKQVFVCRRPTP